MQWFSGLFNKEDSSDSPDSPEQLVFGAELKCPCGFKHSFLIVQTDNIDIDNLPLACVRDSKAFVNIMPFGTCTLGLECEQMIELEDLWENLEPQNMMVGEDEAITMESVLTCKKSGMWIEPVTSGQDGKAARRIVDEAALFSEMNQKYPRLLEILGDPYGSLYLEKGMYEKAIQFMEERLEHHGGEVFLPTIYDKDNSEGVILQAVLARLLPDCDASTFDRLINGLETAGGQNDMDEDAGYDVHTLNAEMIEMLRRDCEKTAEKIETDENARWMEEHKKFMTILADSVTEFAYGVAIYHSMTAKKQYLERSERQKNYNATEEPTNANQQIGSGAGGTEGGSGVGNITEKLDTNNIPNMTRQDIIDNIPNDWNYTDHNGFVHIRDADGNIRIRIDPPDNITNYPHVHVYDSIGNLLDSFGNIVDRKSPNGHIPYKNN